MKIVLIIILIIILIYFINRNKNEHFSNSNIQNDIDNILNNIYSANFNELKLTSDKILEIKQNNKINLTNNLDITGIFDIKSSTLTSNNYLKINNSIIFNNKNNPNVFIDIFPQYFIMIWGDKLNIPNGWVLCDGKTYVFNKDNKLVNTIEPYTTPTSYNLDDPNYYKITTPDLRGVLLQSYNKNDIDKIIQSSKNKETITDIQFNLRFGKETKNLLYVPRHDHLLATKNSKNINEVRTGLDNSELGFDYEESIRTSREKQVDGGMDFVKNIDTTNNNLIQQLKSQNLEPNNPIYYGTAGFIDEEKTRRRQIGVETVYDQYTQEPINIVPLSVALYYIMKLT